MTMTPQTKLNRLNLILQQLVNRRNDLWHVSLNKFGELISNGDYSTGDLCLSAGDSRDDIVLVKEQLNAAILRSEKLGDDYRTLLKSNENLRQENSELRRLYSASLSQKPERSEDVAIKQSVKSSQASTKRQQTLGPDMKGKDVWSIRSLPDATLESLLLAIPKKSIDLSPELLAVASSKGTEEIQTAISYGMFSEYSISDMTFTEFNNFIQPFISLNVPKRDWKRVMGVMLEDGNDNKVDKINKHGHKTWTLLLRLYKRMTNGAPGEMLISTVERNVEYLTLRLRAGILQTRITGL